MTISDATPIQFWPIIPRSGGATQKLRILFIDPTFGSLNTPTTYNELQTMGGLNDACYCNPIDFTDPVFIDLLDTTGQSLVFNMIRDDDQYAFFNIPLLEDTTGHYRNLASPMPSDISKNRWGRYQFSIGSAATVNAATYIPNPTFISATGGWTLNGGSGPNWAYDGSGTGIFTDVTAANPDSDILTRTSAFTDTDITKTVAINITGTVERNSGTNPKGYVRFRFYKDGAEVTSLRYDCRFELSNNSNFGLSTSAPVSCKRLIPPTGPSFDNIGVSLHMVATSGNSARLNLDLADAVIYNDTMDIYQKSDCYQLSSNLWREMNYTRHNDTILITYSNAADFDGIEYDASPEPEFSFRVPGIFFDPEFPSEEKVHSLSNDTKIRTWSKVEEKRKLEIGFVPRYVHKKLKLIFEHDFINVGYIDNGYSTAGDNAGMDIVVNDPYSIDPGSKRWPLKKASIVLTNKNFIKRNLL